MAEVTAERLRQRAQKWLDDEITRCKEAHGARWPGHEGWVMDYLKHELRERLARFRRVLHGQA